MLIGACTAALGGDDSDTEDEKVETTAPVVEEVEETPEEKTTREAKEEAEVETKAEEERIAQEEAEAKAKEESVPREHKSALKKAQSYAETMNMSDSAIYEQLISEYGEKFTPEEAQYAIDNL